MTLCGWWDGKPQGITNQLTSGPLLRWTLCGWWDGKPQGLTNQLSSGQTILLSVRVNVWEWKIHSVRSPPWWIPLLLVNCQSIVLPHLSRFRFILYHFTSLHMMTDYNLTGILHTHTHTHACMQSRGCTLTELKHNFCLFVCFYQWFTLHRRYTTSVSYFAVTHKESPLCECMRACVNMLRC